MLSCYNKIINMKNVYINIYKKRKNLKINLQVYKKILKLKFQILKLKIL